MRKNQMNFDRKVKELRRKEKANAKRQARQDKKQKRNVTDGIQQE